MRFIFKSLSIQATLVLVMRSSGPHLLTYQLSVNAIPDCHKGALRARPGVKRSGTEAQDGHFKSFTNEPASLCHASSAACGYLFAVAMATYLQALLSSSAGVEKKQEDGVKEASKEALN